MFSSSCVLCVERWGREEGGRAHQEGKAKEKELWKLRGV